jgi:hypothetical protein
VGHPVGLSQRIDEGFHRVQRRAQRAWGSSSSSYGVSIERARELCPDGSVTGAFFFANEDGPEIHKFVHYLPAYDAQLARFRDGFPLADGTKRPLRLLEIGVAQGGSLQLWRRFFGPDAAIWGVDQNPACATAETSNTSVRIGSQADPRFLRDVVTEMGGVDLVIDDGSHRASHQRASFAVLFPMLSDGGLYLVEDLHTSYWWSFQGGYRRPGSFIEEAKHLVDGMNGWYHHWPPPRIDPTAKNDIESVTFYDSMVFITKRLHARPAVARVGQRTI